MFRDLHCSTDAIGPGFKHKTWQIKDCTQVCLLVIALLIGTLALPSATPASMWDHLNESEKKVVLGKLKDQLPGLLPQGKLRAYGEYFGSNIENFSTYAGQISAGEFTPVIDATATWGASKLADYFEEQIPEGRVKSIYSFLKGRGTDVKQIGQMMLDSKKSWGDVGNFIWEKAKEDAKKTLNETAEQTVVDVINYALGESGVAGYSPGQLYMMLVRAEMQALEFMEKKITKNAQDRIFELYVKERRAGKSHQSAWEYLSTTNLSSWGNQGGLAAGFGLRWMPEDQLEKLLTRCYAQDATSFFWCIRQIQNEVRQKIKQEKDAVGAVMDQVRDKVMGEVRKFYGGVRGALNRLIDEELKKNDKLKEKLAKALEEARGILSSLKTESQKTQQACQDFQAQKKILEESLNKVKQANQAAAAMDGLINGISDCATIGQAAQPLSDGRNQAKQLLGEYNALRQQAMEAGKATCAAKEQVENAGDKDAARKALDKAIAAARKAANAITAAEAKAAAAQKAQSELTAKVKAFNSKYSAEKLNTLKQNIAKLDAAIAQLKALKGTKDQFETAQAKMNSAQTRAGNLKPRVEGYYKSLQGVLTDFRGNAEADRMLIQANALTQAATSCAEDVAYNWDKGDRWQHRKFPDGGPDVTTKLNQAAAARGACGALGNLPSAIDIIGEMSSLLQQIKDGETDLTFAKLDYELCFADALVAYKKSIDDRDGDGVPNDQDNCPDKKNPDQADSDGDGVGDACQKEQDRDGDGIPDDQDNCPDTANSNQADGDNNGIGDACEQKKDRDGDGISDDQDNCPDMQNPDQQDSNNNGIGDLCEKKQGMGGGCADDNECPQGYVCNTQSGQCVSPFDENYDSRNQLMASNEQDRQRANDSQNIADANLDPNDGKFTSSGLADDIDKTQDFVSAECSDRKPCPSGHTCKDGKCVDEHNDCTSTDDCLKGQKCKDGTCVATSGAKPKGLAVSPANKAVKINEPVVLKALLEMGDGSTKDVTQETTWSTSNPFSKGSIGQYTVKATYKNFSGTAMITVVKKKGMDDITVNSKKITVTFFDHGRQDGDMIDILINGKPVFSGITLTKAPQSRTITMNADIIVFGFRALNEGKIPPNTATVIFSSVVKGKKEQKYELKKDQKTNMNISFSP